jgi:plasmid stabilization system protein ParE
MPKRILWSLLSQQDLDSILNYLKMNWDIKVVERFIVITEDVLQQIADHPKQYPVINKQKKVRKCVLTKHNTLYYRESKDCIDILRIYDNRQDPVKLKF